MRLKWVNVGKGWVVTPADMIGTGIELAAVDTMSVCALSSGSCLASP